MLTFCLTAIFCAASTEELTVQTPAFQAAFANGQLCRLKDRAGRVLVEPKGSPLPITLHQLSGEVAGAATGNAATLVPGGSATCRYTQFADSDAWAECRYAVDGKSGDLTVSGHCQTSRPGVWGLGWSIGRIPLHYAIIVPGHSGVRLTADSPDARQTFDYPMGWEAQLVIVEGPGHGFYVWSDDAAGRYKRLIVSRSAAGWELTLVTLADAPFDQLRECRAAPWRLNVYAGDWRVPARRYRQWMQTRFQPTPLAEQQPTWVRQIRACVIMGLNREVLESLPRHFDPPQTLLYLPTWRAAGYDRNYPDYDAVLAEFEPFLLRARQLGFRVMVHTNYFGVDPLHPLYERFEPFQVRSPWGSHERQWWLWERADPVIRFAYINPALRAWREHFVAAMVRLCRRFPVDALHLDQTLCIYNDHHGRIDGQSMLEGNLALHRELRAALPQVALSGEGLNEVTCSQEAFAQRHAWGLNHADSTWSEGRLRCAHPISSYLFLPYTKIYGYLGYAPPESDQLYAAWNEAYEHWGVLPTLKVWSRRPARPSPFARQLEAEVAFYQGQRVDADLEADWPLTVAFPLRTADGRRAERTVDGRLTCGAQTISRTVHGANQVTTPATIPDWRAYDEQHLLGLDPERRYPLFNEPRDPQAFHVAQLPDGLIVEEVVLASDLATVRTRPVVCVVADLLRELERARCGSRVPGRPVVEVDGPLQGADGAQFTASFETLAAHPAWKGATGPAYARFQVRLPREGTLRFRSEIHLGKDATKPGRSDGVTFGVLAEAGQRQLRRTIHCTSEVPQSLELDLAPLAGQTITLELTVDPGPKRHASFDWARWQSPRVEQRGARPGPLTVVASGDWANALGPAGRVSVKRQGLRWTLDAPQPGAVFLLRKEPALATLPADLVRQARVVVTVSDSGLLLDHPPVAGVSPATVAIGGVERSGLRAHPPDHGRTVAHLPLRLPVGAAEFHGWIGIAGSRSEGVVFSVEANGQPLVRRRLLPGQWEEVRASLARWAGQTVVLSLTTDSDGPFSYDWAHWGEPQIVTSTGVPRAR